MLATNSNNDMLFQQFVSRLPYPPNPFQEAILRSLIDGGEHILVSALAGSGKTSLLMQAAQLLSIVLGAKPSEAMFLAFNKKIRDEMNKRLPAGWTAVNSHRLGNSILKKTQENTDIDFKKYWGITEELINNTRHKTAEGKPLFVAKKMLENLCSKAMLSNMKLLNLTLAERLAFPDAMMKVAEHFNLAGRGDDGSVDDEKLAMLEDLIELVPVAVQKAYDIWKNTGKVTFDEQIYFPIALNLPVDQYRFVFVDEAQDLNAVQQELAFRSCAPGGRMIFVGDRNQCVVEGTFVDNRDVSTIEKWDTVYAASGRNKKARQIVLGTEKKSIENEPTVTIITRSGKTLTTTFHHMHFADYLTHHGDILPYYVYLMYRKDMGYRIGTSRKYPASEKHFSIGYMGRSNQEHADAIWVIHACDSEAEARYYEALYAARYKLPTTTFVARKYSAKNGNSLIVDQILINRLFSEVDTYSGADQLLADLGMLHDYPHYIPKGKTSVKRLNASVVLCANMRGDKPLHQLELSGNDEEDANTLRSAGFNITDNGKGTGWRIRQTTSDGAQLHEWVQTLKQVLPVNIIRKALFGGKALKFTPASHLRKGMMVYTENADGEIVLDEIVDVQIGEYAGNVYELNVSKVYNYIANGIVTHNSIYGFAGADAYSFDNIQKQTNATVLPLNICYRCPTSHLEKAQKVVPQIEAAPNAKEGKITFAAETDAHKILTPGTLVMCRITAPLIGMYFELIANRVPVKLLGRDIAKMLEGILDKVQKMPGFSYDRCIEYLEEYEMRQIALLNQKEASESQVQQLQDSVECLTVCVENFTECHTMQCLRSELKKLFVDAKQDEDDSFDSSKIVVLCTVHRAKGLEADRTAILQPDKMPLVWNGQKAWEFEQEMNILYVALTRSKDELIIFGTPDKLKVDAKPEDLQRNTRRQTERPEDIEIKADVTDHLPSVKLEEEEQPVIKAAKSDTVGKTDVVDDSTKLSTEEIPALPDNVISIEAVNALAARNYESDDDAIVYELEQELFGKPASSEEPPVLDITEADELTAPWAEAYSDDLSQHLPEEKDEPAAPEKTLAEKFMDSYGSHRIDGKTNPKIQNGSFNTKETADARDVNTVDKEEVDAAKNRIKDVVQNGLFNDNEHEQVPQFMATGNLKADMKAHKAMQEAKQLASKTDVVETAVVETTPVQSEPVKVTPKITPAPSRPKRTKAEAQKAMQEAITSINDVSAVDALIAALQAHRDILAGGE